IPFILITDQNEAEVAIQALNLGADHYLKKSSNENQFIEELYLTIENALQNKKDRLTQHISGDILRSILESVAVPMAILTYQDGTIVYSNSAIESVLEIKPNDLVQKKIQDYVFPPSNWQKVKELYEKDGFLKNYEVQLKKIDNTIAWTVLSLEPLVYENQNMILVVIKDITDNKIKEQRLQTEKDELSIFAHSMAHDLRSFLSTIITNCELLKIEFSEDLIDRIVDLTEKINNLLKKSVELADAGLVIEQKKSKVNLNDLVEEIREITIPSNVTFICLDLPVVWADREKLAQLFKNFFENAMVHSKADFVKVHCLKTKKHVILKITNKGKPIPTKIRNAIKMKQTKGFGLKIIQKIVDAHNWTLVLEEPRKEDSKYIFFRIDIPKSDIIER
ncbi:MAG: PAS domain-containing protein, partial [Candidatus Hodarchaeales archaeon]